MQLSSIAFGTTVAQWINRVPRVEEKSNRSVVYGMLPSMSWKSLLATGSLLVGWAIDMSGIQTGPLAIALVILGFGCYSLAVWDWLKPMRIGLIPRRYASTKTEKTVKVLFMVLFVSTLILAGSLYYAVFKLADIEWASKQWMQLPKEVVSGRTFTDETVNLVGKVFVNCTFKNVVLSFDGRVMPFELSKNANTFLGQVVVKTANERLGIFGRLFTELNFLAPKIIMIDDKEGFSLRRSQ
jgi:hypothetical protein